MVKKDMVALILAGGQGSRLGELTKKVAKPAVAFGGKYKIIDFALSNCSNSGIDTVGVLTQYRPLDLNAHIGIGAPWDLDMRHGGVSILPPYMQKDVVTWYKGTANAVYQNLEYLDRFDPEYVLVLSGDHIYKMDYSKMLKYHKKRGADATIAVIDVSYEEAKRFGIMNTNDEGRIIEFEEKPKVPKSTLASMGVYIFNYQMLKKFLIDDEADKNSEHDFGKNIIPSMLRNFKKLYTYAFDGYWRDIGTIDSIWETNMDLLRPDSGLDMYEDKWRIYTASTYSPALYIGETADLENSMISEGCVVKGTVKNSIVFTGAVIEEGAVVEDSLIMLDAVVKSGAHIKKSIICNRATIGEDVCVGDGENIKVVGEDCVVTADTDCAAAAE